jgi:RNA polymerase sigma-70 factor (ECF subfamily)
MELSHELIEKALGGHQESFEMMFKSWYSPLCSYASSFVKDKDEAEEIVQSAFISVWEKRTELQIESSLKSYMYRSVRNSSLNRIKHQKIRQQHAAEVKGTLSPQSEPASGKYFAEELEHKIANALEKLPTQCRVVFELSRFGELRYAEIAEKLGISIKTVENQMGKALRIMREELVEYLPLILLLLRGFLDE